MDLSAHLHRMVILETFLGVGGGVAGISSGYWIKAQGYFVPAVSCIGITALAFFLIPLLPDSKKINEEIRHGAVFDAKNQTRVDEANPVNQSQSSVGESEQG